MKTVSDINIISVLITQLLFIFVIFQSFNLSIVDLIFWSLLHFANFPNTCTFTIISEVYKFHKTYIEFLHFKRHFKQQHLFCNILRCTVQYKKNVLLWCITTVRHIYFPN